MLAKTSFAALTAIVLGAELAAAAPAENSLAVPAADNVVPKTVWQVGDNGMALHLQSQLQCPATVGEFHRTRLNLYGPFGVDVSCDYQNTERDEITLYIALRPQEELAKQFDAAKAALVQRFANATPLPDAEQQTFTSAMNWSHVIYRLSGVAHTGLWMTKLGGWNVEYRATFSASRTDAALETMTMMTDTVQKTAGQHIAACQMLGPLQRNGRKIVNQSMFPALSISGTLTAKTARENTNPASAANWCVIRPFMDAGARFLFWRNAANQTDGIVERLTPLNENDPVTVFGIIDTAWPQMIKNGDKPNLAYDIVIDSPDAIQLVGVYEGHPPIEELVRFAQRRTVGIYGKIDKKDGKTDIYKVPP